MGLENVLDMESINKQGTICHVMKVGLSRGEFIICQQHIHLYA